MTTCQRFARQGKVREVSFHGCSDYVERFWNAIPGEKQPGVVYRHVVTKQEAIDYAHLRGGMTVHMMAHQVLTRDLYLVTEAMSEDIDDTALNAKVAELLAAGALLIDDGDGRYSIVVRTYEVLAESWGTKEFVDDPKWDAIQRINQVYYHQKHMRELHEYFVANSRVFTATELAIIADYKRAEAAYYELFPRPERKKLGSVD
jgi:hypothetical protein